MGEIELVWEEMMYRFYKDTHMGGVAGRRYELVYKVFLKYFRND